MSLHDLLDPIFIIRTLGLMGVVFIIFAESGLFFGFFLPGDSLLFTAGFLASQGILSIWWLLILCFFAAVLGDNVGYAFGKKTGPMIFNKDDSFFFQKKHIERANNFYKKYGKKTIVIARFIPIVRTFAPIVAGVGEMNYKIFVIFNLIGGFVWTFGLIGAGYFLGKVIPGVDKYLLIIIVIIIFASLIPVAFEYIKSKKDNKL
jgi:membrane-associated protein